jgi:hypothetical protein
MHGVSHLIGQIVFVFLVLVLYRLLKPVNTDHAVAYAGAQCT